MKQTDTIIAIKVEPDKHPELITLKNDGTLMEQLKNIVHGDPECCHPFSDDVVIVCDDEGKCKPQATNRAIFDEETGELRDIICGPFVILRDAEDGQGFASLTLEQIQKYDQLFEKLEIITILKPAGPTEGGTTVRIIRYDEWSPKVGAIGADSAIVVQWDY